MSNVYLNPIWNCFFPKHLHVLSIFATYQHVVVCDAIHKLCLVLSLYYILIWKLKKYLYYVCSNANPLHYYVLRVPRKVDRWRQITHRLGRPHYVWDENLYSVWEKVEVRVTVSVTVCVVLLCCVGWWWKEGRNPVPAHSLLFSKSTKGATRLNIPIRRTNRYQQYYMPSEHTYCGRVWNLIQDCDVQSSD